MGKAQPSGPNLAEAVKENIVQALMASAITTSNLAESGILLEQYKVYVDSMEKLVARRQGVHTFFSTVNSFLLTVAGLLLTKDFIASDLAATPLVLASASGIALVVVWWQLSIYYGLLAKAKFAVIHALEQHLPSSPFWAEWVALDYGRNRDKYRSMSSIEKVIPIVFGVCYAVIGVIGILIIFNIVHLHHK